MRRLAMMLMAIGLLIGSTVEARTVDVPTIEIGSTIEVQNLYGLPFNRPPYYRRGPRPPAIKEHDRYMRPGRQPKVRVPFRRSEYLILPKRKAPAPAILR